MTVRIAIRRDDLAMIDRLINVQTSTGHFAALLVLYCITMFMRANGHHWTESDHTLILGALLALLKNSATNPTVNSAPNAQVQVNQADAQNPPKE